MPSSLARDSSLFIRSLLRALSGVTYIACIPPPPPSFSILSNVGRTAASVFPLPVGAVIMQFFPLPIAPKADFCISVKLPYLSMNIL